MCWTLCWVTTTSGWVAACNQLNCTASSTATAPASRGTACLPPRTVPRRLHTGARGGSRTPAQHPITPHYTCVDACLHIWEETARPPLRPDLHLYLRWYEIEQ